MEKTRGLEIHFENDLKKTIECEDPERLVREITDKKDGWFTYENLTLNISNIKYIEVVNIQPWEISTPKNYR
jgi:hypothetical protein